MSYFGYAKHEHGASLSSMAEDKVLRQQGFNIVPLEQTDPEALLPPVDPEMAVIQEAAAKGYIKCEIIAN